MPHIYTVFPANSDEIRAILKEQKTNIRKSLALCGGYEMSDIAVIPRPISDDDIELADNILPLEFVIDTGSRTVNEALALKKALKRAFIEHCGLKHINFGIWVRPFAHSAFVEHKP